MNRRLALVCCAAFTWAFLAGFGRTDDKAAPGKQAQAQFEQLKKLAGTWTGKASHGDAAHDATINYRVTAAGSAVEETIFSGTDHEMVTMYHLDGNSLILTHYCALGNQPRMRSEPGSDPKKIVFRFLDGTNMNAAKDMHMHEATMELVDADHLRATWTAYSDGKPEHSSNFEFTRKK
jgi:hypothetical protein